MHFSLIQNGADSLKKVKNTIDSIKGLERDFSYHLIKDAIIFLNQGIEVLMKHILSKQNESLIFKDLKKYMAAKGDLLKKPGPVKVKKGFGHYPNSQYTVFDTGKGKNLETINLDEALARVQLLCDIEISDELRGAIGYIKDYRNKLMHHSIEIYEFREVDNLIEKIEFLYELSLEFFEEHIPGIIESVDLQRFELTKEEWEEQQREMQEYYSELALSKVMSEDF